MRRQQVRPVGAQGKRQRQRQPGGGEQAGAPENPAPPPLDPRRRTLRSEARRRSPGRSPGGRMRSNVSAGEPLAASAVPRPDRADLAGTVRARLRGAGPGLALSPLLSPFGQAPPRSAPLGPLGTARAHPLHRRHHQPHDPGAPDRRRAPRVRARLHLVLRRRRAGGSPAPRQDGDRRRSATSCARAVSRTSRSTARRSTSAASTAPTIWPSPARTWPSPRTSAAARWSWCRRG